MAFHEVRFPVDISRGSGGGPRRVTDIVTLRSGFEQRNSIWADSRRNYDAGLGLQDLQDLYEVIEFFEARRGQLHGFRWRDWSDYKSTNPVSDPAFDDVQIATGDGSTTTFQLQKIYTDSGGSYTREIKKPVSGTVLVGVAGSQQTLTTHFTVDTTTGIITFVTAPTAGQIITAGFEFDVPVRFDQDNLDINIEQFNVGAIPQINIVEIRV